MPGESASRPEKPAKPANLETPGLIYRPRRDHWILLWSPRSDLIKRGYPGKTMPLWPAGMAPYPAEPTANEWEQIAALCDSYQLKMLVWAAGGIKDDPKSVYDGTLLSLSRIYQTDPDSPFKVLRYRARLCYASRLATLEETLGAVRIKGVTFRDLHRWYNEFAAPAAPGGPRRAPRAYHLMAQLRLVLAYAKLVLNDSDIARVYGLWGDLKQAGKTFAGGGRRRKSFLTYAQARLICAEAHRQGFGSVALMQAIGFECGVRQKDLIGEWVPRADPGITDIVRGPMKWLMGARWEEVDEQFVWTHKLSKSISVNAILNDDEETKTKRFALLAYPMVRAELERIAPFSRANFPASGPIIICESHGRPWNATDFRARWRAIARACGISDNVQNRDSRPGAATEAELSGVEIKRVQRHLGHSRAQTTEIYLRDEIEAQTQIAAARAEKRK